VRDKPPDAFDEVYFSRFVVDLLANRYEMSPTFCCQRYMLIWCECGRFFILPALIVNIRSCLLPRINKEPVSVGVVVIPTISSELATNFTLSLLQDISMVPIIVVVVVVVIG